MLQITNLTITLSKNLKTIIKNFSFSLNGGDKAVIIGEEGNGKSTLLKCLFDENLICDYAEYTGEIAKNNTKIGYLYQEFPEKDKKLTISEYLRATDIDDTGKIFKVANTLQFDTDIIYSERAICTLSGGEKVKLQLMRMLIDEPDILLMDEPTNDIDIDTLEWLERFINNCRLPILYVSHDETLIENTANTIIHIEQLKKKAECRHTIAKCGYKEYIETRLKKIDHQEQVANKERADYERQMERYNQIRQKVDHDQSSISRQDPHSGQLLKKKMKSVISMGKRFEREKENFTEIPEYEQAIFLNFNDESIPNGKQILNLSIDQLKIDQKILANNIKLEIVGNQHLGLIGENGVGKSTLLKQIKDILNERTDINVAYMPQNYEEALDYNITPIEFLSPSGHKDDITKARTYMGSVKYTHDEMEGKISELSGGQKAKLLFIKMILDGANVLILDEPTRNFSPLSNPVIRNILKEFKGTIISVTHDRKFLNEVCNKIYRLTEDGLILQK